MRDLIEHIARVAAALEKQNEILERRNAMLQQVTDNAEAAREDTRQAYARIAPIPDPPAPDGLVKCDGCRARVTPDRITHEPDGRLLCPCCIEPF